ncbi:MAG: hypothetical protein IPF94_20610 [Betaproteobacteria bacterium]|nr:hypothetical protein [Betaproteobacteria bacterium]
MAPWGLAALVLTLVARQARTVDWPAVWRALQSLSVARLAVATALALASLGLYASFVTSSGAGSPATRCRP